MRVRPEVARRPEVALRLTVAHRLAALALAACLGLATVARAADAADVDPTAEAWRLGEEMRKLAQRDAWKGVERAWIRLVEVGVQHARTDDHCLAAQAAEHIGDTWSAYQRLLVCARLSENSDAKEAMKLYRADYGRITVRRVEIAPIELSPGTVAFRPDLRRSIEFAQGVLQSTGGFDGMLPIGTYAIGPYVVDVAADLQPAVVQRVMGDGKKKQK